MAFPFELYDVLLGLDRGIANRWKARSRGDQRHKLTEADIVNIVGLLIKDQTALYEAQAAALMTLVWGADFTPDGLATFNALVQLFDDDWGLFRAGAHPLVAPGELKFVNDAFGMGVISRIRFRSPKTGLTYGPESYLAIQQLIATSKILVLEVRTGGVSSKMPNTALYQSNSNRLFIYDSLSRDAQAMTIVHEATHAIQDWRNVGTIHKYAEADAYIAGAVADHATGSGKQSLSNPIFDVAYRTAQLVIDGAAVSGNAAWTGAYEDVVAAVGRWPGYAAVKDTPVRNTEKGEGSAESDQFDAILQAIELKKKNAIEFAKLWGEVFKEAFGNIAGRLSEVLPQARR